MLILHRNAGSNISEMIQDNFAEKLDPFNLDKYAPC